MRTFIATDLPTSPALQQVLSELQTMRPPLKVVSPDQFHITLKFLGETDEALLPDLLSILHEVAASVPRRSVVMKGLGAFPSTTRPSVVWIGFTDPHPLPELADQLSEKCRYLGFAPEQRAFQPHLTLARLKEQVPKRLIDLLHKHHETDFGSASVRQIVLYRSDLKPSGPIYTPLGTVELAE